MPASDPDVAWRRRATAIAFGLGFGSLSAAFCSQSLLYDADSYFHLAVARDYLQHGIQGGLRWARFSAMHEAFGDKELLFHLWLAPWVALFGAELGGKLALACQDALLLATLTNLAARTGKRAAIAVPLLVFGTAGTFALRMLRLRPETPALIVLLWATWAAAEQRYRTLAALACVFALAYTAFHALLGMCAIWVAFRLLTERRLELRLVLYPLVGVLLGLVVHPHFPHNIEIWVLQSIDFFQHKDALDVGGEIQPFTTKTWLALDATFVAGLVLAACTRQPRLDPELPTEPGAARTLAAFFLLIALPFVAMQMQMGRFALYTAPFITLGAAFALHARGEQLGAQLRLPGGYAPSSRWLLAAGVLATLWVLANLRVNLVAAGVFDPRARDELQALGAALPAGARVAASWNDAEDYLFWAPEAVFLNVLDPIFMRVPHPTRQRLERALMTGAAPDVPLTLGAGLDSEWLAFRTTGRERLLRRLTADPRMVRIRSGQHMLYRVLPAANSEFMLSWTASVELPDGSSASAGSYPRADDPAARALEGYVDATRVSAPRVCMRFVHELQRAHDGTLQLEFAPYGPSALSIDGVERVRVGGAPGAVLSEGVALTIELPAGTHSLAVRTCPADDRAGFYLRKR